MKFSKWFAVFFCFTLTTDGAYSQKYSFKFYTTSDGFPPFAAERILQDRLGNMWFTTSGGVVMYNGKVFLHYTTDNGLPDNSTRAICEDAFGNIWIGTLSGGVVKFQRNGYGRYDPQVFRINEGLSSNAVLSLAGDAGGTIWVGTKNGVTKIQTDSLSANIHMEKVLAGQSINAIFLSKNETNWFGAMDGQLYWTKNNQTHSIKVYQETSGISGIEQENENTLWVSSFDHGVKKIRMTAGGAEILNDPVLYPADQKIYGLFKNRQGTLLASTFGSGVVSLSGYKTEYISVKNGLPENNVTSAYEDREGILWIATANSGLAKLVTYPFVNYDKESGLAGNFVLDVIQDRNGAYWFTSYENGLTRYDGKEFKIFTAKDGLPHKNVYALMEDSQGRIWVSTSGDGVFVYNGKKFASYNKKNIYLSDVLCFLEDREKNMWFGTDAYGAIRYSPNNQFVQFTTAQGLAGLRVFSMIQDKKGRILFGCGQPSRFKEAGGLSVWDPERYFKNLNPFTTYSKTNGFPSDQVTTIFEDSHGNIWIGTRQAGLTLFSEGIVQSFTKRDGLTSNDIVSLQEDTMGRLWIGTVKGLNIWDGKTMETYTTRRGLLSDEIYENAMIRDKNGDIWFGTSQGVCRFKPEMKKPAAVAPLVYVDKVRSFGKDISTELLPGLSYQQNSLDFEVAGIEMRSEKDMMYQFMLAGYDKDWEEPTSRDYISFTNLDPGQYVFKVRAKGVSGVWSEVSDLPITIIPAYWQTLWFQIGSIAIILILLPVLFRYGVRGWRAFRKKRSLRHIAHYKIKDILGEGSVGVVYLAFDKTSRIYVALKVIGEKLMDDPDNKARFKREGRILSKLRHPFVVKVYATGEFMGRGYIAMEILKNGDLKSYLIKNFPLKETDLERILIGLLEGLVYIHKEGIVHRDLKCANVMLDDHLNPKIMDFALSKSALITTMTRIGTIMGTLGYVAPEQITGGKTDQRSDIFSFGVMMYELLTGQLPFRGENEIAMIHSIFNDQPVKPSELQPGVQPTHEKIVMKCLEKDPENRYQSCDAILRDLRPEEIKLY
jgi:ligand-binding sensor domain-containing protein